MKKLLKKMGISVLCYSSFMDEDVNRLDTLVKTLQEEAEERERENEENEGEEEENYPLIEFKEDTSDDEEEKPKRKPKYQSPEYIIIYDDISSELKSPAIVKLLKENRHYHIMNIISSQYVLDLLPSSRQQIDLWLILKGQTFEKLETIYKNSNCSLEFEKFIDYYNASTKDTKNNTHNFFYFFPRKDIYRRNFSDQIIN